MRTVLYGGTFNPPHIGHYLTVKTLSGLYDRVIVMPAAVPPHKPLPENSFGASERIRLARLTFGGFDNVEVSDFEITKGGVSYTIDTVNALDIDGLTLALGTDSFNNFEKWRGFRELLSKVKLAVTRRDGQSVNERVERLKSEYNANVTVIDAKIVEISSSELRGGDMRRAEILENIHPKRLEHSLGTESEAVRLAALYGEDLREAALAALLHDCTKHWPPEKHLQYCAECNIISDRPFSGNEKFLHGITAAELARRELGVSGAVYGAIKHHTMGRPGMSGLEMIIYLADKLEPTREYKDVPAYRRLAYENRERAVLAVIERVMQKLVEEGSVIHPATFEARDYYKEVLGL
ncbi:MAG: bis(5'-nucleosyl)-tetraphosphatase (symmetrical) YqeK [Oscillospiraceae bacterium]|nr:bis(5'-nucleosyl)-tetraphosphatase (symmetrical) YqeK [Oscillospiraceae bacterium]